MRDLYLRDVGIAMGAFLAVTYVFCVAYSPYFGFVPVYDAVQRR